MTHACICDWLGLPDEVWPPDHYRLLGLPPGEGDAARIEQQVHDRLEVVRRYQLLHPEHVTEAMNRLAQAFVCLTDPVAKQAYDAKLFHNSGEQPLVEEAIAETPSADSPDPLAWLYNRQTDTQDVARAVTQLDLPAADNIGPPEDAQTREVEDAPPVRRPVEIAPAGNGVVAPTAPEKRDVIVHAAHASATARRGLGTKRALYHRIARTRQLLRAWHEAGQFLGHPGRRLAKPVEATDLIHGLISLRTELKSFPPLLGQAGQPGYLVIALARQQVIVPTFQTLLPSQREALARDWRAGLKLLDAHLQFLRQELRAMRHTGLSGRMARGMKALLGPHLGLFLMLLMVLALVIAFCRSVGAEWVGFLLESAEEGSSHASVGPKHQDDGVAKSPRAGGPPGRRTESGIKNEPRSTHEAEKPQKLEPQLPPEFVPEVDPPAPEKKAEADKKAELEMPRRLQADDTLSCTRGVTFASDKQFISCNGTKNLSIWSIASNEPQVIRLASSIECVAGCSQTDRAACGDADGNVYLFKVNDFPSVIKKSTLKNHHAKRVNALAFSSDGKRLVSGGEDGKVVLWDAETGESIKTFTGYKEAVRAVALSKDAARVFLGCADRRVYAWDVQSSEMPEPLKGPAERVEALVLSPKDDFLYGVWKNQPISRWDVKRLDGAPEALVGAAICLALSADGRYRVSEEDGRIKIRDAREGELLFTLDGKGDHVCCLAFSPDGNFLVSGHDQGVFVLWPISWVKKPPAATGK
jgi:hypothetical protein